MRGKWLLASTALLISPLTAIFTDDAGHIDYHQALLGIPQPQNTFFHQPQSSSNASLLYSISDKAVLGAVNPRDGSLVWRQALADQPVKGAKDAFLVAGDSDGRVTTGFQSSVSSWDALDGRLNWAHSFEAFHVAKGLRTVPTVALGTENIVQDLVAVAAPIREGSFAMVVRLAGDGSATRWEWQDKNADQGASYELVTSTKHAYYITKSSGILSGGKAKVVVLDITNGKELHQYNVAVDSEAIGLGESLSIASGSELPILLSTEKPYKSIKFNQLGTSKVSTINIDHKGEDIVKLTAIHPGGHRSTPHFLLHVQGKSRSWAEVYHIDVKTGGVSKAYSLPATAERSTFAATVVGSTTYFTRISDTEVSVYSSESHGQLGRWPRTTVGQQVSSIAKHAVAEVSTRGASGLALRIALSSNDGWSLIRNGEQSWSRSEVLAYVTKAVWSDDIVTANLAREVEVEAMSNPVAAYLHRVTRHLLELRHLPQTIMNIPAAIFSSSEDAGKSTREILVGSKLVLAATSRYEIVAIDAAKAGAIRWITALEVDGAPATQVVHLSVEDTRLTVFLSNGQIFVIDTTTGKVLQQQKSPKPFDKVVEIPGQPASIIVRVSPDGKPELFSELAPVTPTEGSVLVTIDEKGAAIGWSIGSSIEKIWTLQPDAGAEMIDIIARPAHDPVSSVGSILGDRSVHYKYINPNIALLTALSSTSLTVYIVNAVTGAVLHTATHAGVLVEQPISATASDNKFTYTFTMRDPATSGLSSRMIISELYEAEDPNDRGLLSARSNYSAYSPDAAAKPYVLSQAFTVAEPLSELTTTQTTQGITSRQVIAYLANLHSVVGIPGHALNARRLTDRDPTSDEMEAGLSRYNPILDLEPRAFLSHSLDVLGIQKIMTAPTLLESTSFVFAFGHDVFGMQVAPSNTFDILGKGFKRIQLVLTVVALYAGVLAIRPIARRKMVQMRWK